MQNKTTPTAYLRSQKEEGTQMFLSHSAQENTDFLLFYFCSFWRTNFSLSCTLYVYVFLPSPLTSSPHFSPPSSFFFLLFTNVFFFHGFIAFHMWLTFSAAKARQETESSAHVSSLPPWLCRPTLSVGEVQFLQGAPITSIRPLLPPSSFFSEVVPYWNMCQPTT